MNPHVPTIQLSQLSTRGQCSVSNTPAHSSFTTGFLQSEFLAKRVSDGISGINIQFNVRWWGFWLLLIPYLTDDCLVEELSSGRESNRGKGVWPKSNNWCLWELDEGSRVTADTAFRGPGSTDRIRLHLGLFMTTEQVWASILARSSSACF